MNNKWIVDDDFSPIKIADFDKKYALLNTKDGVMQGLPADRRTYRRQFDFETEALDHSTKMMEMAIRACEIRLDCLKEQLRKRHADN